MKKILVLSAGIVLLTITVRAQTDVTASIKNDEVNLKTEKTVAKKESKEERKELRKLEGKDANILSKIAFYEDFGDIPVSKWERKSNLDEATFTKNDQVMVAYYDYDANLVGTTMQKTFGDLPARAQMYIDNKYMGYSKEDVILFDDNEHNQSDMVMFENQFDDEDTYFVELKKGNDEIVLQVYPNGDVAFFKQIK